MLELSLTVNAILIVTLVIVMMRTRLRIVEEKLATFAGCLAAATSGLAHEDIDKRFDAVGRGFATLRASTDEGIENMKHYLTRAAMLRLFRQAALADIGEHMRLLALQTAGVDDEPGNEMLEYISRAQDGEREPRDIWGDAGLAAAEFVASRKALNIYRQQISATPAKDKP